MKFLFILSLFAFQAQAIHKYHEEVNYRLKAFIQESASVLKTNDQGQFVMDKKTMSTIQQLMYKYNITEEEFKDFIPVLTKDFNVSVEDFSFVMTKQLFYSDKVSTNMILTSIVSIFFGIFAGIYVPSIVAGVLVAIIIFSGLTTWIFVDQNQSTKKAFEYLFLINDLDDLTLIP